MNGTATKYVVSDIPLYQAIPLVRSHQEGDLTAPSHARRHSSFSRNSKYVGAIAFERSGDPDQGSVADAKELGRFGVTPDDLSAL